MQTLRLQIQERGPHELPHEKEAQRSLQFLPVSRIAQDDTHARGEGAQLRAGDDPGLY